MLSIGRFILVPKQIFLKAVSTPAFGYREFRFLWIASLFNSVGFVGEQVVLGWVTLELSGSPFIVGTVLALRMAPFFFLGLPAGAVADRVDRRLLMTVSSIGMAVLGALVGGLIFLDLISIWHLMVLTFVGGSIRAVNNPARQSFVFDVVGSQHLVSGLALVSLSMRFGGIVGSISVGLLIGRFGADAAYFLLAVSYLCSAITVQMIQSRGQSAPTSQQTLWENIKGLVRELRGNSTLLMVLLLAGAVEVLGFSHQALLPTLANDVFNVGPEGLGLMNGLRSFGGIVGIALLSMMGDVRRKGLMYLVVLHGFGVSLIFLGLASSFHMAVAAIILINGMGTLSDILSQSLVQTAVANDLRGRAMGSWVVAVGMGPVGHVQIGALASLLTVTFALVTHGAGLLILGIISVSFFPRLRKL